MPYDEILAVRHVEPQQQCGGFSAACPCAPGCCGSDCSVSLVIRHALYAVKARPFAVESSRLALFVSVGCQLAYL